MIYDTHFYWTFAHHIAMWLRQLSFTLCAPHSSMNHMACIMNLAVWTFSLSMSFTRLSHSQRAVGQGQQETNSCQANSPLMHGWFSRRSYALGLWDEMGYEVAVICTIKSSCFSSKLRLEIFSADIQSRSQGFMIGSSHWKTHCWTRQREESYMSWLRQRALLHRVAEPHIAPKFSIKDQI